MTQNKPVSEAEAAEIMAQAMAQLNGTDVDVLMDEAKIAYRALVAAGVIPQWREIESAPKDGTCVLIFYRNSIGKNRIIRASYTQKFTEESDNEWAEYSEEKDCYYSPEGWYEQMEHWDEYGSCFVSASDVSRFTHWMPLPPTPTQGEQA